MEGRQLKEERYKGRGRLHEERTNIMGGMKEELYER
jgi:hypothetical protein